MHVVETDFRHYNSAIGRFSSIDLLSELAPNITPYRYGFNNPIYWQDRTGLFESEREAKSFALRNNLSGFELYKRTDGLWGVDHNSIFYVRIGTQLQISYVLKGEMIVELSKYDGTTGSGGGSNGGLGGGNIGGNSSENGFAIWSSFIGSIQREALAMVPPNRVSSGIYGPYIPDGFGFSASFNFMGSTVGLSFVSDKFHNSGLFFSYSGGFGSNFSSLGKLSMGFSFSIDAYDNFGNDNLFKGILGQSIDYSAGYLMMGSRSIPLNENGMINTEGVYRHSIGIDTGIFMSNSKTIRLW